jgi:hypothetical protein
MRAGSGRSAPLRSRARVTEKRTGIGMAAKGTKPRRGRGTAAATSDAEAQPSEPGHEASASPAGSDGERAETEASGPTSSPQAPVPHDDGETPDEAERERARAAFQASEPRTAAPTTGIEASTVRRESWWPAAGLAAVLLVVALVGIWFLTSGDSGQLDQQAQRLDAVSDQVQTQTSRLDAAEQAISALQSEVSQMASSVNELRSTADELQATGEANRQDLERITQNIENLASAGDGAMAGEAVGELRVTLQSLDARVAGLEQGSDLDDITGRVGRLEQEIVSLREQEAQRVGQAEANTALGRAYAALTARIGAGEPFAEELEAVSAELPNAPGLQTLRPIAGEGAATVQQLQSRLEEVAASLPQAEPDEAVAQGDGFFGTMGQRLQGMVRVRRADEADMPAALDRALEALQRDDVAAAISEIEQVSDTPSDEIETWLADARKRRDAQAGLNELSDAVLRQFAGRQ